MYIDGFLVPVPTENKDRYIEQAKKFSSIIKEFGATRMVEGWGDDISHGKQTDFYRSVAASEGENVLFSWIEWPSKEVRDAGMKKMMEDPRMKEMEMPFDGKRMIFGGFSPVLNEKLN